MLVPLLLLLVSVRTLSGQDNVVPNGTFSIEGVCEGDWSGRCAEGFRAIRSTEGVEVEVASTRGNASLRMGLPRLEGNEPHAVVSWTSADVQAGVTYGISAWTRALYLSGSAALVAIAERADSDTTIAILATDSVATPSRTSVWQRIGTQLELPDDTERLTIELRGYGSCAGETCGTVWFDNLVVAPALDELFAEKSIENVCAEDDFLSIAREICLPRATDRGFSMADFEAALPDGPVITLDACSESALRDAVDQAAAAGGATVRIPPCSLELRQRLNLPDNTILEGAGVGLTLLTAPSVGCDSRMVRVERGRNVIFRDVTVIGSGCVEEPIVILYSDNVLLERIEIFQALRNGLLFAYSRRIDVRYLTSHETQINNGISSKDCYLREGETWTSQAICERRMLSSARGNLGPGSLWTESYAVYSNHVFNNRLDNGLAMHGTVGELAGNLLENNRRGAKLPDSQKVRFHHNHLVENLLWGIHLYSPIIDRPPTNLLLANNVFERNGEFPIRLEGTRELYMILNEFRNNMQCYDGAIAACEDPPVPLGTDALRIGARVHGNGIRINPDTYVCAGSEEDDLPVFSVYPTIVDEPGCPEYVLNVPPHAIDDRVETAPATAILFDPLVNDRDADGDALTLLGIDTFPQYGSASLEGDRIQYTPEPEFLGSDVLTYRMADGRGGVDLGVVEIDVRPPNQLPIAVDDTASTHAGESIMIDVLDNDSDPDDDPITIDQIVTAARNGSVVLDDGIVTYTPATGFQGADNFAYQISDDRGGAAQAVVAVTVLPPRNQDPVAVADSILTAWNTWVEIDVLANDLDPDGDPLTLDSVVTQPTYGAVALSDAMTVVYIPNDDFLGLDVFRYRIVDGQNAFAEADVFVTVEKPNEPPVGANDFASTSSGVPIEIPVLENDSDPDGDALRVINVPPDPQNGTLTFTDSLVVYIPDEDFVGEERLYYVVSDGRGGTATATIVITVTAPVDAEDVVLPDRTELFAGYPNPATTGATVRYNLARGGMVRLTVYDLLGKPVIVAVDGERSPGAYSVLLDLAHLPSGAYLVVLRAEGERWSHMLEVVH